MKVLYDNSENRESGVIIKDGVMTPYTNVDLTDTLDFLKQYKKDYNSQKPTHMHHVASIPADVIVNIMIEMKLPKNNIGWDEAVKEAVKRVKNGDLSAFKIHEY